MKKQRILKIGKYYFKEIIEKTKEGGIKRNCDICYLFHLCSYLSGNPKFFCSTPRLKNASVYFRKCEIIEELLYELSLEGKGKSE